MSKVSRTAVTVKVRTKGTATVRVTVKSKQERPTRPKPIRVNLPDVPAIPPHLWGEPYAIKSLLTDGEDNPKLAKSNAVGTEYRTWGLTLAPANQSGYQTCGSASPGCTKACLNNQGMARVFPSIYQSRVAKTVAFFERRQAFLELLRWEMGNIVRLAQRDGFTPAVRLNVLSDLPWERLAPWLFTEFPGVSYYDYTKHAARMVRWCQGQLPANYHLTFSRSERNEADCLRVLELGGTVAVVFQTKDLPAEWQGYPVLNGDETDMRFADEPGHVVGLYAKGSASKDESGFVVRVRGLMSLATVG